MKVMNNRMSWRINWLLYGSSGFGNRLRTG
jgi:hypothetical protein